MSESKTMLGSNFAILDVQRGRRRLREHFDERPRDGPCPPRLRVPVTITGYIDSPFGADDGVSQEFVVVVEKVDTHGSF